MALLCIIFLAVAASGCMSASDRPVSSGIVAVTVGPANVPVYTSTPAPSIMTAISSASPDQEWYYENYSWDYNSVQWNFHLQISRSIYEFYKGSSHDTISNYPDYARTAEDKDFLADVTAKFKNNSAAIGFTDYDNVMNVLAFVQSIPSEEDAAGTDYTRYPIETLVDQKGDSTDKSILAAAMLSEMGYDVVLLKYPEHMAVGVKVNGQGAHYEYKGDLFYYAETTATGWDLGKIPGDLEEKRRPYYPWSIARS